VVAAFHQRPMLDADSVVNKVLGATEVAAESHQFYFRSLNRIISRVQSTHMAEIIMTQQR
jgi:hypothetical protein